MSLKNVHGIVILVALGYIVPIHSMDKLIQTYKQWRQSRKLSITETNLITTTNPIFSKTNTDNNNPLPVNRERSKSRSLTSTESAQITVLKNQETSTEERRRSNTIESSSLFPSKIIDSSEQSCSTTVGSSRKLLRTFSDQSLTTATTFQKEFTKQLITELNEKTIDINKVADLVKKGADLNYYITRKDTALIWLIKKIIDTNSDYSDPVFQNQRAALETMIQSSKTSIEWEKQQIKGMTLRSFLTKKSQKNHKFYNLYYYIDQQIPGENTLSRMEAQKLLEQKEYEAS